MKRNTALCLLPFVFAFACAEQAPESKTSTTPSSGTGSADGAGISTPIDIGGGPAEDDYLRCKVDCGLTADKLSAPPAISDVTCFLKVPKSSNVSCLDIWLDSPVATIDRTDPENLKFEIKARGYDYSVSGESMNNAKMEFNYILGGKSRSYTVKPLFEY